MRLPDFESLRPGAPGCPSDQRLHELVAEELSAADEEALRAHITSCERCPERLERMRRGFDLEAEVDPRALLAGIRRRLSEEPPRPSWAQRVVRMLLSPRAALPLLAAGSVAAVLLLLSQSPDPPRGLRRKGALALHVHRALPSGGSEELVSGAAVQPGDRLRFVVDLPRGGRVRVLGVEADGRLYTAWPLGEPSPSAVFSAGRKLPLSGAVSVDAKPGSETLYLVLCPPELPAERCRSAGPGAAPSCPPSCRLAPFLLSKTR